jgi:hypothetical protein
MTSPPDFWAQPTVVSVVSARDDGIDAHRATRGYGTRFETNLIGNAMWNVRTKAQLWCDRLRDDAKWNETPFGIGSRQLDEVITRREWRQRQLGRHPLSAIGVLTS